MDDSVLIWCCTINPSISEEEYMACYNAVLEAWPDTPFAQRLKDMPRNYLTLRELISHLLPLLMIRQQRIPRSRWILRENERGKKCIEKFLDGDRQNSAFAGFTTAFDGNMVLLAGYSGKHNIVYNIGLGVKKLSPDGVPVQQWAQSQQHKLTQNEVQMLGGLSDTVLLSRLMILLTIKESLINGLGQPVGFDLSRIECNPAENWLRVDSQPLPGWEFRLFRCQGDVKVGEQTYSDQYQVSVAFYRGNDAVKFTFVDKPEQIQNLTQYFPFDRLVDVIPRLLQEKP